MEIKEQLDIQDMYSRQAAQQAGNPAPAQPEPEAPPAKPARSKKPE